MCSLENAVDAFFAANTTAKRQQCDEFALSHGAPPVTPVQIQGLFSYTVLVGAAKIFQFRLSSSHIDPDVLELAAATHGNVVPTCKYHGTIGESQPLCMYEINKLLRIPYILARATTIPQPLDSMTRQQRTVADMAK
jgi:hypothetical protein